jgi:hypothetical protein
MSAVKLCSMGRSDRQGGMRWALDCNLGVFMGSMNIGITTLNNRSGWMALEVHVCICESPELTLVSNVHRSPVE